MRGFIGGWPADPISAQSVEHLKAQCDGNLWIERPAPGVEPFAPGTMVVLNRDPWWHHLWPSSGTMGLELI